MEVKCVSTILSVPLLTVAVCNNIKAMDDSIKQPKVLVKAKEFGYLVEKNATDILRQSKLKSLLDQHKLGHSDNQNDLGICELALIKGQEHSNKFEENPERLAKENYPTNHHLSECQFSLIRCQEYTEQLQKYLEQSEDEAQSNLAQIRKLTKARDEVNNTPNQTSKQLLIEKRKSEQYQKREAHKKIE